MKELKIRFANPGDAEAMRNVYAPYVRDTAVTFEYEVPSVREFAGRIEAATALFPWLVCESADGKTAGYAYASRFHPRAAYQWDAEVSIYLSAEFHRGGVGTALYGCLESILLAQGYRNLYALITHPNTASEGFHRSRGYRAVGIYHETGYKFGKWHDVIVMEKRLAPLPKAPEPCRPYAELGAPFLSEQIRVAENLLR